MLELRSRWKEESGVEPEKLVLLHSSTRADLGAEGV